MDSNEILYILIGAGVLFLAWFYAVYVSLVTTKNKALEALSGVDVQLKKRHDLVPNLVEAVKRYMTHEADLFKDITRLRTEAEKSYDPKSSKDVAAHLGIEALLGQKMGTLIARVEDYPDLKASENVLHLQRSLNEIEAMISAARRFYNSSVTMLNNITQVFPKSVVAAIVGIGSKPYFQADVSDKGVPDIEHILSN